MENRLEKIKIHIGYSSQSHKILIDKYETGLENIKIDSDVLDRHFSFDGGDTIRLVFAIIVNGFSEGLFIGIGELAFNHLASKTAKFFKDYVKEESPNASFILKFIKRKDGNEEIDSFEADKISEKIVDKALNKFFKHIQEDSKIEFRNKKYFFDSNNTRWILSDDENYQKTIQDFLDKYESPDAQSL